MTKIQLPMYPVRVFVVEWGKHHNQIIKVFGTLPPLPNNATALTIAHDDPDGPLVVVVFVRKKRRLYAEDMNVCAHEAMHVIQEIERRIEHKGDGGEHQAYLIGHIAECIAKEMVA